METSDGLKAGASASRTSGSGSESSRPKKVMSLVRQFSGGEASEQGVEKQAFVNPLIGGRGGETAASPEEEEQEEQEESNPSPPDQAEPAGSSEGEQAKENKSRRALARPIATKLW